MSRNNSFSPNNVSRHGFRSHSRSPNRQNGFRKYSRSMSRSPVKNKYPRRSPRSRSAYSPSPRRSFSRSPRKSQRKFNKSYSRSLSRDYRRKPRRSFSRSRSPVKMRRKIFGDRDQPTPSNCIGVFGLSKRTEEKQLWDIFERYGHIKSIQLVMDKYTRMSQGFGFIYFDDLESATKAKNDGNGMDIDGKIVRIDYSITKKAHTPTPGVYLGRKSRRGGYDDRDYDGRNEYDRRDFSDRRRPRSRTPNRRSSSRSYGSYPRRDR